MMRDSEDRRPIDGPSAWFFTGARSKAECSVVLSTEMIAEIRQVAREIEAKSKTLASVEREDFAFPRLIALAAAVEHELDDGRGFLVIKGFPVEALGESRSAIICWGIGNLLGRPMPQNLNGDRLYAVENKRSLDGDALFTSKTNVSIDWHSDAVYATRVPDYVGLFMVRASETGGATCLVSGHALYNALLREQPQHLRQLFEPYLCFRSGVIGPSEEPVIQVPVFERDNGVVTIRYNRQRIEHGYKLKGTALTSAEIEAMDCLEAFMNRRDLSLEFNMEAGEMLLLHNRLILHARSSFTDSIGPSRQRLLYRLWIQRERSSAGGRT